MPAAKDRISRLKALQDDNEETDLKNGHTLQGDRERSRRSSGSKGEATMVDSPRSTSSKSAHASPAEPSNASQSRRNSDMSRSKHEETIGGEVTVKLEPGQPPKLARSSSQKIWTRPAPLFDDYPDKTAEARAIFEVIPNCIYGSKHMGSTEHGMDCDCNEEWGKPAYISTKSRFPITHAVSQIATQRQMLHVVKTLIASTVRQRLSVPGIAGADHSVKINVSNVGSMQMSPSFKRRRKATVYEQILI